MTDWRQPLKERLKGLSLRPEREAEIIDELSQHLDDQVRDLVAGGTDGDAARTAALAELDAPGALARRLAGIETRQPLALPAPGAPARGRWAQARWQDVRHSVRALRRSPIFATAVLATLALTIGPTTAILSIGNWLLWRPTPGVTAPHELVLMTTGVFEERGVSVESVSNANLRDLAQSSKTFTGIAGIQEGNVNVAGDALPPVQTRGGWVTANAFDVLGVPLAAGRTFRADEDREPRGEHVAIIREGIATRGFGSVNGAVGRTILLNGRPMLIVGVVPDRFIGLTPLSRTDVWYLGTAYAYVNHFPDESRLMARSEGVFHTFIGRLAPGATIAGAQAEVDVLLPGLADRYPGENGKFKEVRGRLETGIGLSQVQRDRYARLMSTLLIVGGALLLLGCINVANMLMVRSVRTVRDRAIRLALGASRARLALLQLTESALLAFGGAAAGVLLAVWLKQLVLNLLIPGIPAGMELNVPLDLRVLGMTMGVALMCGLVSGFIPALLNRKVDVAQSIAVGGRTATRAHWLRAGLASLQFALSLALITGSLLLVATLRNLYAIDLGFDATNVTRHAIDPGRHGYRGDRQQAYFSDLLQRLSGKPGIEAVSISGRAPFGSQYRTRIQDPEGADRQAIQINSNNVSSAYFAVLGTDILRGRAFTDAEAMAPGNPTTFPVVISQNLARRLFADADPIGRTIVFPRSGSSPAREASVIGVVEDVRWGSVTGEAPLLLYEPFPRFPGSATLLVRSPLPDAEVTRIVGQAAKELDAALPVSFSQPLISEVERRLADQRVFAWVLSLLGWIAFALAGVGLYGLLAQSVSERAREFGIRLAIGSGRGRIFALVLRQAAWIGVFGVIGGLALAAFGSQMIEALLFGVTRLDVSTYILAAGVLVVIVFVAGLWPARSATRIQPVEALRIE